MPSEKLEPMSDSAARKSARTTFNNHANPESIHAFETWAVNNPTGSLSVLVLNKTGAVRQLVVTNSEPSHCPLPCLTIKQEPFSVRISPRCSEEPFIAQRQERREHFRPLPAVLESRHGLSTPPQLPFCSEGRKDASDDFKEWIGSHTFMKVFPSFATNHVGSVQT